MSYDFNIITQRIKNLGMELGFSTVRISNMQIPLETQNKFNTWLSEQMHGNMDYLANNTELRFDPSCLVSGSISIISVNLPYINSSTQTHINRLHNNDAYISSYALGRDYHKVLKQMLNKYALRINEILTQCGISFEYRAFTDSAPIMEVEIASNAGMGWRGKNTLLINKDHGSFFFLGELFTNLPLIIDSKTNDHCGSCTKCMQICPTNAFVSPYVINANKCISYLTIENKDGIPIEFRDAIGNRIYGCDDCQLFCPWNKFSQVSDIADFSTRHNLDKITLSELLLWNEDEFKHKMQGSAIYRIGYIRFVRNIIIACGNSNNQELLPILQNKLIEYQQHEYLAEHLQWAINKLSI